MSVHHYGLHTLSDEGFLVPVPKSTSPPAKYTPPVLIGQEKKEIDELVDHVLDEVKKAGGRPLFEDPLHGQVGYLEVSTQKLNLSQSIVFDNRLKELKFNRFSRCGSITVIYRKI